ncbi:pectinesterase-like [Salvia hispanica]|uniref:pectinesterase-like n=1 Tax=Salvia hispanica TaxID=49212 RepID=UPI002009521E|nr:pectinesterase-like [Salvia hispanica]
MVDRKSNATTLGAALVVACLAAAVAANDEKKQALMANICEDTGMGDSCNEGDIKEAKEAIKKAFDAAVEELKMEIKNATMYKELEKDYMTRQALDKCERVLASAIDEIYTSFEKISQYETGHNMDYVLGEIKIWLSGAIGDKETCFDSFAKTKSESNAKEKVREMLKTSGRLLTKSLAMVIEFEKNYESVKKDLGELVNSVKTPRQLLDDENIPDYVSGQGRKLVENPKIALKPNVVVAQDGSGNFKTFTEAVQTVPKQSSVPYVILVKEGLYMEYVMIPKMTDNVVLIGEGPLKTIISGNKSFAEGFRTGDTSTLTVEGRLFTAKDIGVENTRGPEGQFFRECRISRTVDFIFGNAVTALQKCVMVVRKPMPRQTCEVTVQGREEKNVTGITIIQGCNITAEDAFLNAQPPIAAYLGRPWKTMSRTIIMQTTIEGFISPDGWQPWDGTLGLSTLFYAEYKNYGPGADTSKRVDWAGIQHFADDEAAKPWTPLVHFLIDDWIRDTGVPFDPVFM